MKIKQTHEFEIDVKVNRGPDGDVELVLTEIDSDGGEYHYPKLVDGDEVLITIDADQIPEDWTDEQIVDAYFNSPYGVA
jgi:hypothetical protein